MIRIIELSKEFGSLEVIKGFNLHIKEGETIAIVGPSGCGKSTLLNCITGLDKNYHGKIEFKGVSAKSYLKNNRISVVLQKYSNFEWLTVKENIETAFINSKIDSNEKSKRIIRLLQKTGLYQFVNSRMNELSGGMRQRVAVARALAQKNEILAFDEPFGALDVENRISLQNLFKSQIKENNITALFITHDIDEAILISDRIIVLKEIPTSIIEIFQTQHLNDRYSNDFNIMKHNVELKLKQ